MRYLWLLVFVPLLLMGLGGMALSWNSLHRMKQLRGWEPGATVTTATVRDKAQDTRYQRHWVSLSDQSARTYGTHRVELSPERFAQYEVGDPIEVVYLPGDPEPYPRNDILDSDGNFAFRYFLLAAAGGLAFLSVVGAVVAVPILWLWGHRQSRWQPDPVRPSEPRRRFL